MNRDKGPARLLLRVPREKNERGGGGGVLSMGFPGWVGTIGRGLGANGTATVDGPTGELVEEEAMPDDECADEEEAPSDGCSIIKPNRQYFVAWNHRKRASERPWCVREAT